MIETKLIVGKNSHCWVDRTRAIADRSEIFFGAFNYRIFGEVFTERGTDFNEAFDKYLTWRALTC